MEGLIEALYNVLYLELEMKMLQERHAFSRITQLFLCDWIFVVGGDKSPFHNKLLYVFCFFCCALVIKTALKWLVVHL